MKDLTDNMTAEHIVNNIGCCRQLSYEPEVRKIWGWAAHIPGIMNVETDAESTNSETRTERELNESCFQSVLNHFINTTSVDLLASRKNT